MNDKIEKYYDEFVERQVKSGINHRHLSIQGLLEENGLKVNANVLEIGAGIGTQTELLASYLNNSTHIVVNDISSKSIEVAKSRLKSFKNIEYKVGSIDEVNIDNEFDCILLPDVLEHIPINNHKKLFQKIDPLLKNDGFVLIHIPDPYYLDYVRENYPEQLQIIDQSIHISWIQECCEPTSLYISSFKSYSIYCQPEDYNVYILKKKKLDFDTNPNVPKESFIRRVKRAIKKHRK